MIHSIPFEGGVVSLILSNEFNKLQCDPKKLGKLNAALKVESSAMKKKKKVEPSAAFNDGLMLQVNIEDPTMIMMSIEFAVSHRLIISYQIIK